MHTQVGAPNSHYKPLRIAIKRMDRNNEEILRRFFLSVHAENYAVLVDNAETADVELLSDAEKNIPGGARRFILRIVGKNKKIKKNLLTDMFSLLDTLQYIQISMANRCF